MRRGKAGAGADHAPAIGIVQADMPGAGTAHREAAQYHAVGIDELPADKALDGQEVIDYLSRSDKFTDPTRYPWPSLLLLDIHLPKKSGLEVLQWIRQHPALDTLVVLMFTSSELDLDVHSAYRLHANGYLVKPSAPAKLVDLCRSLNQFWLDFNLLPPNVVRPADVPSSFLSPLA